MITVITVPRLILREADSMIIFSFFFDVTGLIAVSSPAIANTITTYIPMYALPLSVMFIPCSTSSVRSVWDIVFQKQNIMITDVTDISMICHHRSGSAIRSLVNTTPDKSGDDTFISVLSVFPLFIISGSLSSSDTIPSFMPYADRISLTVTAPGIIPYAILAAAVVKKLLPRKYSLTPPAPAISPSNRSAILSPATAQNSMSWLTITIVLPFFFSSCSIVLNSDLNPLSIPLVGSSISSISGSYISSLAKASLCFSPPDRSYGCLSNRFSR